jgi:hypothetical protein
VRVYIAAIAVIGACGSGKEPDKTFGVVPSDGIRAFTLWCPESKLITKHDSLAYNVSDLTAYTCLMFRDGYGDLAVKSTTGRLIGASLSDVPKNTFDHIIDTAILPTLDADQREALAVLRKSGVAPGQGDTWHGGRTYISVWSESKLWNFRAGYEGYRVE